MTDPKEIAEELKTMGHGTSKLPYNAKQSHKTASTNLLRRNLISKPNNKEIYSLDRLLNIKLIIKFPMNKKRSSTMQKMPKIRIHSKILHQNS